MGFGASSGSGAGIVGGGAQDLNPIEAVWSWLASGPLSNDVSDGVRTLDARAIERLVMLKRNPRLLRQLWKGSSLPFPKLNPRQPQLPAGR